MRMGEKVEEGRICGVGFRVYINHWISIVPELWLDPDFVDGRVLLIGQYRVIFGGKIGLEVIPDE